MRILIMNWRDPKHPQAGGAEAYLFEQARRWRAWGHQVEWLTAGFPGSSSRDVLESIPIRRTGNKVTVYFTLPIVYRREFAGRFDVIIDSSNGIPFFTPLFARTAKVSVVHHIHREVFRNHLPAWLACPLIWCEEHFVPWLYRDVTFITVSEDTRNELLRLGVSDDRIALIPNGVSASLMPGKKNERPMVVYLGRLKAYKLVNLLIEAFARVRDDLPDAKLYIAGTGDTRPQLERSVAELKLRDAVSFEGFVEESRKRELLQGAWVSVTPSEMEGWGITVIESNACGTPAIAFNVPGLRESIVEGVSGLLVSEGDDLAPAIARVLHDGALRRRLSEGAVARAAEFSWERTARESISQFEKLLRHGDSRQNVAILMNTYEDAAESGGFVHLFQSAKRWNFDVTVFGPEEARTRVARELPGAAFVAIPSWDRRTKSRAISYALRTAAAVSALPKRLRRFDAIYTLSQSLPDLLPAVVAAPRKTVAQVFHLQPLPWKRPGNIVNNVIAYLNEAIGVALVRRFVRHVVVLTPDIEPALRLSSRVRITHAGSGTWTIPVDRFVEGTLRQQVAIYVGRLHPAKGLDDVVDAWARVHARLPQATLVLVGTGDESYVASLKSRVERLGLDATVHFTGFVSQEEKARTIAAARAFVTASREEGWGIAVAEALALGVPCVTYDLPVFRRIFSEGRIGVPIGDIDGLANGIVTLLQDDALHATLSARGREFAAALSWDSVAKREEEAILGAARSYIATV
ncbi:MAG: glycosyltransferase [Candidatus Eremiobacteraeota bacterium]|nr:glycosyltransferase [Candidatus Eremiobacteraeota bacterium]